MVSSTIYQAVEIEEPPTPFTGREAIDSSIPNPPRRPCSRSLLASVMLAICIVAFVLQTELARFVQHSHNYQKPYFILYISHSVYAFLIPLQLLAECIGRNRQGSLNKPWQHITQTIRDCLSEMVETFGELPALRQPLGFVGIATTLAILFTIPAYLWYVSVGLTSAANLTAIFNTGCFFAYLFSILMLHDRLVASKVGAVVLCIAGVFTMAYGSQQGGSDDDNGLRDSGTTDPSNLLGIIVAVLSAVSYGFYEVFYKKYASPTRPSILFANLVTGTMGLVTFLVLWIPLPLLHFSGLERFELPDLETFGYLLAIGSLSLVYNASFMCIIALVTPVFAAVGVMLTVPAVAVADVLVTGVMVPLSTLAGSVLILLGFVILHHQVKHDVLNEDNEDLD